MNETTVSSDCAAVSDRGLVRSRNEDNFAIVKIRQSADVLDCGFAIEMTKPPAELVMLLVADGMGGHGNGDVASHIVASLFTDFIAANASRILAAASNRNLTRYSKISCEPAMACSNKSRRNDLDSAGWAALPRSL